MNTKDKHDKKSNLPNGWTITNMGMICSTQYGYTTSASNYGDVKLLRTTDITSNKINWERVPYCKDNPEQIDKYLLKNNDIVISRAGSVGHSFLVQSSPIAIFASYLIRVKTLIFPKFLSYFLQSNLYWNAIHEKKVGVGLQNVNATKIKQIKIPIPPLNEQKRITTKIESIFTQIDDIQTNLKKIRETLKQCKQSTLTKAFEGKLVPQDPNDESIFTVLKKMNKNIEKEVISKTNIPNEWFMTKLSNISEINPTKPGKNNINANLIVSFLPMKNVEEMTGKINLEETRKYSDVRNQYTYFQNNDIIFAKITPCMENGKIAIVNNLKNNIGFGSTEFHVIRVSNNLYNKFYFYYLIQNDFRDTAKRNMKGTAGQLRISFDYLSNVLIPIPPISEQKRIVSKIESIFDKINTIDEYIEDILLKINMLKKSVLQHAFEGKLVPQDPNDESAHILLEKIKKQNTKIIQTRPKKEIKNGK